VLATGIELQFQGGARRPGGNIAWNHIRLVPEFGLDGVVVSVLAIARDITEMIESRDKIQRLAYFDPLTALPNRSHFNERIQELGSHANGEPGAFGLMLLDLDGFKEVNDSLGHAAGDALLGEIARRLTSLFTVPTTVARLGGDEFALLLPGLAGKGPLSVRAAGILRALAQPFRWSENELTVTGSIGIARHPVDSSDPEVLLKQADAAMYYAKQVGRNNFQFYDPAMTARATERIAIGTALRRACERNEFEIHYQPQVMIASGEWVGGEALVRWNHPELGLLAPSKFIAVAESTGLIIDIGRWVLLEACRAASEWQGERPFRVAVNLSSRQFVVNDLVTSVEKALQATGCRPEWIELEITESLLLEDDDGVRAILEKLSALGVSIAIDDFGTGYSALAYLTRFPIDTLKIDRSFMRGIDREPKRSELMKAIIAIAKALRLQLIAEGVESREQGDFLLGKGCDLAQGYFYGQPMPRAEFGSLLRAKSAAVSPSRRSSAEAVT
jgi:diguanylate cyclase (GGDEF)-like protein